MFFFNLNRETSDFCASIPKASHFFAGPLCKYSEGHSEEIRGHSWSPGGLFGVFWRATRPKKWPWSSIQKATLGAKVALWLQNISGARATQDPGGLRLAEKGQKKAKRPPKGPLRGAHSSLHPQTNYMLIMSDIKGGSFDSRTLGK